MELQAIPCEVYDRFEAIFVWMTSSHEDAVIFIFHTSPFISLRVIPG